MPLDDVMGCLRDAIPKLTRSALHRCLQRNDISRLPVSNDKASKRGTFRETKIGFVHIDSCALRLAEGKLIMFLAIDRVSKFTVVEFHQSAGKMEGAAFLRHVIATFPYALHTVLTDNGMAFADLPKNRTGPSRTFLGPHIFDRVCLEHGIEHRLTKPLWKLLATGQFSDKAQAFVVSVLGTAYGLWLVYAAGLQYMIAGAVFFALGNLVFIWARREHARGEFPFKTA